MPIGKKQSKLILILKLYRIFVQYIILLLFHYNSNKQLYFLHIKKTAGTSLRKFLERQFHVNETLPPMNIPRFMEMPAGVVRRLHFIAGHFDTWYLRNFKTNPYVITVLREPIDRFVSEYFYWKDPQNIDDDPRKPRQMSNISLESFAVNPMFGNIQVKSLSEGLISPSSSLLNHEKVLSNALATLQNMSWFGIAEFSNQSTDILTYMYGWRPTNFD